MPDMKFEIGALYEFPQQALEKVLERSQRYILISLKGKTITRPNGPMMFLESKIRKHICICRDPLGEFSLTLLGWKILYKDSLYILEDYYLKMLRKNNIFLEKIS